MMAKKQEEKQEEPKADRKPSPERMVRDAEKNQDGANYAIEFELSPEDAEPFEYLSEWNGKQFVYRVVARLNMKGSDNIKVQLLRIQNKTPNA